MCISGTEARIGKRISNVNSSDDVSIPNMTSEKFLAPTPPAESQKCVSRERKLDRKTDFKCG